MVVLQHHHPAQVLPVHGRPAHQHGVLLHQAKARRGFARAGHFPVPACVGRHPLQLGAAGGDAGGAGQAVEGGPLPQEETPGWAPHLGHQCEAIRP